MPSGTVLAVAALVGVVYFGGIGLLHGAEKGGKWIGKEAKKAGSAIVHVIKKI